MSSGNTTTYRRPSVSIGMGLDGNDYAYLTKTDKDSTGFFITFNVPFKRQDVFNELLSDESQLGVDGKDTGLEAVILKPGRESGKAVSAAAAWASRLRLRCCDAARRRSGSSSSSS